MSVARKNLEWWVEEAYWVVGDRYRRLAVRQCCGSLVGGDGNYEMAAAARAPFAESRETRASSSRMRRYAAEGSRLDDEHGPEWWLGLSARERAGGLESTVPTGEYKHLFQGTESDETGTRFTSVARPIGMRFLVAWLARYVPSCCHIAFSCITTHLARSRPSAIRNHHANFM